MNLKISSLSALAVFAAASLVSSAQTDEPLVVQPPSVTVGLNDIVVGFRPGGNGSGTANLEIKAGSVATLSGYTTEHLLGNFNTSLTGVNANWAVSTLQSTALFWGAAGVAGSSNVFASSVWDISCPGAFGTANSLNTWNTLPSSVVSNAAVAIQTMEAGFNGIHATQTGDGKSITIAKADAQSWTIAGGTGSVAFGAFNPNNNGFTQAAARRATLADWSTAPFSAEDLYSVSAGSSKYLGTFALYTDGDCNGHKAGDLTFTASAIPEPSTYAAILGVASLGLGAIRRRQKASAG